VYHVGHQQYPPRSSALRLTLRQHICNLISEHRQIQPKIRGVTSSLLIQIPLVGDKGEIILT